MTTWRQLRIGILVTGELEEKALPGLLQGTVARALVGANSATGCGFALVRRVGQLSPRKDASGSGRVLRIAGADKPLPTRDQELGLIGAGAMRGERACDFLILADDLEPDRRESRGEVFRRYREAFDGVAGPLADRISVHFFVNMVESYFLAAPGALNGVLGTSIPPWKGDVEEPDPIRGTDPPRHAKNEIARFFPGYRETDHGAKILASLDVEAVLGEPGNCASFRTIFAWIWQALSQTPGDAFRLGDGSLSVLTGSQIARLP